MGRLYYQPGAFPDYGRDGDEPEKTGMQFSDYLQKVASLIPAEIIGAYLTMVGLLTLVKEPSTQKIATIAVFLLCFFLTPVYFYILADAGKPKWYHIGLSSLAFLVWAYVTSGDKLSVILQWNAYDPALASIILIAFSVVSALIPLKK